MKRLWTWRKSLMVVGLGLGLLLFARQLWLGFLDARALGWHIFVRPGAVTLTLFCGLLIFAVQMIAWQFTLKFLGVDLGLSQILEGFQLSLLPRYIPGSIWGYLSRSQWLEQVHDISYARSLLGSLLEGALQALTALIIGLGCLGLGLRATLRWPLVGSAIGLFAVICLAGPRITRLIGQRITKDRTFAVRTTGTWLWLVIANMALRVVYGLSFLGVVLALTPSAAMGWSEALAASNLSWLLGFLIPIVPTGIGVREWALAKLLADPSLLSVPQASLAAVLFRFALILTELVWLAVGLGLFAHRWQNRSESRAAITRRSHG